MAEIVGTITNLSDFLSKTQVCLSVKPNDPQQQIISYMDCLWGELYSAINSNQWSNAITQEQADYLRAKYL